jgi:phospholipid-binding lipoprotein MlaA
VLPILGPSTLRDGVGKAFDLYTDPVSDFRPIRLRNSAITLRLVNVRADLLDAGRILEEAALDKYVFLRDAYLQRRRSLIYDGQPPREEREPQEPVKEKTSAVPVNAQPAADVNSAYLPRIPNNYEAVMAAQHALHR